MTAHPTLPPTIRFADGTVLPAGPGFKPVAVERGSDGVTRALAQCNELSRQIQRLPAQAGFEERREVPAHGAGTSPEAFRSLEEMSRHLRRLQGPQ